jgi:hypothetical protein
MMLLFFYNKSSSSALNKSPPRFSEGRQQRGPKATLSSLLLVRIQTSFATTSFAAENTKVFLREREINFKRSVQKERNEEKSGEINFFFSGKVLTFFSLHSEEITPNLSRAFSLSFY